MEWTRVELALGGQGGNACGSHSTLNGVRREEKVISYKWVPAADIRRDDIGVEVRSPTITVLVPLELGCRGRKRKECPGRSGTYRVTSNASDVYRSSDLSLSRLSECRRPASRSILRLGRFGTRGPLL